MESAALDRGGQTVNISIKLYTVSNSFYPARNPIFQHNIGKSGTNEHKVDRMSPIGGITLAIQDIVDEEFVAGTIDREEVEYNRIIFSNW